MRRSFEVLVWETSNHIFFMCISKNGLQGKIVQSRIFGKVDMKKDSKEALQTTQIGVATINIYTMNDGNNHLRGSNTLSMMSSSIQV